MFLLQRWQLASPARMPPLRTTDNLYLQELGQSITPSLEVFVQRSGSYIQYTILEHTVNCIMTVSNAQFFYTTNSHQLLLTVLVKIDGPAYWNTCFSTRLLSCWTRQALVCVTQHDATNHLTRRTKCTPTQHIHWGKQGAVDKGPGVTKCGLIWRSLGSQNNIAVDSRL